eukprot:6468868-Amphidinium_carterae.1
MPRKLNAQERHAMRKGLSKLGGRPPKCLARAVAIMPHSKAKAKAKAEAKAKAKAKAAAEPDMEVAAAEPAMEVIIVEEDGEPDPPLKMEMQDQAVKREPVAAQQKRVKVEQPMAATSSNEAPAVQPKPPPTIKIKMIADRLKTFWKYFFR